MAGATRRSFEMQQSIFTMRRVVYAGTLALIGIGAAALKMGWAFESSMQQASVAMHGFGYSTQAVNTELGHLYNFAAFTPFQFNDIVLAVRRLLPFTHGFQAANQAISDVVNTLSAFGVATPGALGRATIALQHMLSMGRVTGLALNQLSRDNIPLILALAAYYRTTDANIRDMVKRGLIPTNIAFAALHKWVTMTPGVMNAAYLQATKTLHGSFTTFKDILMKSVGGAEMGIFGGLQRLLKGVDDALFPLMKGNRPITLYNVATAFDKVLSPKSHVVINAFVLLSGALKQLVWNFKLLATTLSYPLRLLGLFGTGTGAAQWAVSLLGRALGIVLTAFIAYKTGILAAKVATEAWTATTKVATVAAFVLNQALLIGAGRWAESTIAVRVYTVAVWTWALATRAASAVMALLTGEVWAFTAALYANPITWIVAAVIALTAGLVILYFKWQAFHNAINNTVHWLWSHWPYTVAIIMGLLGPVGLLIVAIGTLVKYWKDVYSWATKAGHAMGAAVGFVPRAAHTVLHDINPLNYIPHFATGGVMAHTGVALVGDGGPELVALPAGARVTPLGGGRSYDWGGGTLADALKLTLNINNKLTVDGRELGSVLATIVTDKEARQ